jgi:hypothetical protein
VEESCIHLISAKHIKIRIEEIQGPIPSYSFISASVMIGKTLVIQYVTPGKGLKPDVHVIHNNGGCNVWRTPGRALDCSLYVLFLDRYRGRI